MTEWFQFTKSVDFKLIGQNKYILMYDVYMKGKYQFTETTDLKNFKVIDSEVR